jgi:hypothetical protein
MRLRIVHYLPMSAGSARIRVGMQGAMGSSAWDRSSLEVVA